MRDKKCKACGISFTPIRQFQTTCNYTCALDYARLKQKQNLTKQKNKAVKQLKENDSLVYRVDLMALQDNGTQVIICLWEAMDQYAITKIIYTNNVLFAIIT